MKPEETYRPKGFWATLLDASLKLSAPAAVLVAALLANEYQTSMTSVSLLSKREEAESNMRAKMFSDLIGPITGPNKQVIPVPREQLMVELLALNFHEHFELKPLMLRVDQRLAKESWYDGPVQKKDSAVAAARNSLRSIARRVVQRQIALLTKENSDLKFNDRSCIYQLELSGKNENLPTNQKNRCLQTIESNFNRLIALNSPNQSYKLVIYFGKPTNESWNNRKFDVYIALNHVCSYTAEMIGVDDLKNAHAEIDMIEALRTANYSDFRKDDFYYKKMRKASEFKWNSTSDKYDINVLKNQAAERWARIVKYSKALSKLEEDGKFYTSNVPDISSLNSPGRMAKLPADISCSTTDNNKDYLNSSYSFKVDSDFSVTPFDFPFTDNTLLADGTRFSIVLDNVRENEKSATFKIIWFPKDYIAARERPINYTQIRSKLGISLGD